MNTEQLLRESAEVLLNDEIGFAVKKVVRYHVAVVLELSFC